MRSSCCLCMCVCVCVSLPIAARKRLGKYPPIVARQRLGRNVTAVTNTHATIEDCWRRRFQCGPCRIKESKRLILPLSNHLAPICLCRNIGKQSEFVPDEGSVLTFTCSVIKHIQTHSVRYPSPLNPRWDGTNHNAYPYVSWELCWYSSTVLNCDIL
jgi:hypothetical protein